MRQVILLGNPDTRRTFYFQRAAHEAGLRVFFLDWKQCMERMEINGTESGIFMKIDPPVWESCSLEELGVLTGKYKEQLSGLSGLEESCNIRFLNRPGDIASLLDKRECKKRLRSAGLPVTEAVDERVKNGEQLLEVMKRCRMFQVFIKPVTGSGAAGIAALWYQPGGERMVLYTCALEDPVDGKLVNTKKLRRFTSKDQILPMLDRLLRLDCIVERWYAKAAYQEFSYDLRAVMQEQKLDFLLARLSKGPITNLHLNNHPLAAEDLRLPDGTMDKITRLCRKAMDCYPGLQSAGIDLLLEKGSLKPRIIEMNGQGDLIYQDIFNKNVIYRHQVEIMKNYLTNNQ